MSRVHSLPVEPLESTDLGPSCHRRMKAWMDGILSGTCLSVWVHDKFQQSVRMRMPSDSTALDILSGGPIPLGSESVYTEYFAAGSHALLGRAVSILGEKENILRPGEYSTNRINSVFRRLALRTRWARSVTDSHRSIPDEQIDLKTLHVYLEVIRAYLCKPPTTSSPDDSDFILAELTSSSSDSPSAQLNTSVDEYLVKLMRLKAAGVELISSLEEDGIYSVLGISSTASDNDVKRAYRARAMLVHPDKAGGDKELFQQLNEAYEKILSKRGVKEENSEPNSPRASDHPGDHRAMPTPPELDTCRRYMRSARALCGKLQTQLSTHSQSELINICQVILKAVRLIAMVLDDYPGVDAIKGTIEKIGTELDKGVFSSPDIFERVCGVVSVANNALNEGDETTTTTAPEPTPSPRKPTRTPPRKRSASVDSEDSIQRKNNADLLKRLNQDLLTQQAEIRNLISQSPISYPTDPKNDSWMRRVILDYFRDIFSGVPRFPSEPERMRILKEKCRLFDLCENVVAVPVCPVTRLAKYFFIMVSDDSIWGELRLNLKELRFSKDSIESLDRTEFEKLRKLRLVNCVKRGESLQLGI
jgi:hypothetical protein